MHHENTNLSSSQAIHPGRATLRGAAASQIDVTKPAKHCRRRCHGNAKDTIITAGYLNDHLSLLLKSPRRSPTIFRATPQTRIPKGFPNNSRGLERQRKPAVQSQKEYPTPKELPKNLAHTKIPTKRNSHPTPSNRYDIHIGYRIYQSTAYSKAAKSIPISVNNLLP